jgi:hypothetical protein
VVTLPVATVNRADLEPRGILTLDRTLAAVVLELESDTSTPPVPAASIRLTVPVPEWPLTIVLGLTEMLLSAVGDLAGSGLTMRPNVLLTPE